MAELQRDVVLLFVLSVLVVLATSAPSSHAPSSPAITAAISPQQQYHTNYHHHHHQQQQQHHNTNGHNNNNNNHRVSPAATQSAILQSAAKSTAARLGNSNFQDIENSRDGDVDGGHLYDVGSLLPTNDVTDKKTYTSNGRLRVPEDAFAAGDGRRPRINSVLMSPEEDAADDNTKFSIESRPNQGTSEAMDNDGAMDDAGDMDGAEDMDGTGAPLQVPDDVTLPSQVPDDADLRPALLVLARRKRTPGQGVRYRYPGYQKRPRAAARQNTYDAQYSEEPFFHIYDEYPDSDVIYSPPQERASLFRERAGLPPREKFMEAAIPSTLIHPKPGSEVETDFTKVIDSPFALNALAQLYTAGDRAEGAADPERAVDPAALELIRQTLRSLEDKKTQQQIRDEQINMDDELFQELLNRATREYGREEQPVEYSERMGRAMVRNKRNTRMNPLEGEKVVRNGTATTGHRVKIPLKVSVAEYHAILANNRKKRAFGGTSRYERHKNTNLEKPLKRRSQEEIDDFLTREYFKTIARSVGNKKKRMAHGQSEPDKRSNSIDAFLDNPETLQYIIDQLQDAEEAVGWKIEQQLLPGVTGGAGAAPSILRAALLRLDALERLRDALRQLQALQLQPDQDSMSLPKKRRKKSSRGATGASGGSGVGGGSGASDTGGTGGASDTGGTGVAETTPVRHPQPYLLRAAHQCPALDRTVGHCQVVSVRTGDLRQVFVPACVHHQVCYMCGSGAGISGHECDALLSSGLEASCDGTLECLGAAGDTFNLLSDGRRYETSGYCAHQPCVRRVLESRR